MPKDFATLKGEIQTEMQLDPGLISDSERGRFINRAVKDLANIALWEKETTIPVNADTAEVPLPAGFLYVVEVLWDKTPLAPIKRVTSIGGMAAGTPIGFIIKPGFIELVPKPTQAGNLFVVYRYEAPALVNPGDTVGYHHDVDDMIIDFAVAHAHRKNGNIPMFNQYMSYYMADKTVLLDKLLQEVNSRVRTVQPDALDIAPLTPFDYL